MTFDYRDLTLHQVARLPEFPTAILKVDCLVAHNLVGHTVMLAVQTLAQAGVVL